MATRGWENVAAAAVAAKDVTTAPSKYHNRRVTIDGVLFDSIREAGYWQGLQAQAATGEITELRRQVIFPLLCPIEDRAAMVATYVADFTYRDRRGALHVVDVKGVRTAIYKLKRKWLQLQDGIAIEEV